MNRKELLTALRLASIGLSKTGLVDQADHFLIRDEIVTAFNDEICCRVKVPGLTLAGGGPFTGAVPGQLLIKLVADFPDDEVSCGASTQSHFVLSGKAKKAGLAFAPISLDLSAVPQAKGWKDLPDWFPKVVAEAQKCCVNDQMLGAITCIRIATDAIEACDNQRLFCHKGGLDLEEPFYMHAEGAAQLAGLQLKKYAVTGGWMHFKMAGAQLAVRGRQFTDFPQLRELLQFEGESVELPLQLVDVAERCAVMADGDSRTCLVNITVGKEGAFVEGTGPRGWYKEKVLATTGLGRKVSFRINPGSLAHILREKQAVVIGKDRLRAEIAGGTYCSVLQPVSEVE